MRIISGFLKNHELVSPENGVTHPMSERARGAIFNSLGDWILGMSALDLYAGTGALGIEALSRGAIRAVFVENDRRAARALLRNVVATDMPDEAFKICRMDVKEFLKKYPTLPEIPRYELVFADPPYDKFNEVPLDLLANVVESGGTLVLSHPGKAPDLTGFSKRETRKYAGANITFYHKILKY